MGRGSEGLEALHVDLVSMISIEGRCKNGRGVGWVEFGSRHCLFKGELPGNRMILQWLELEFRLSSNLHNASSCPDIPNHALQILLILDSLSGKNASRLSASPFSFPQYSVIFEGKLLYFDAK